MSNQSSSFSLVDLGKLSEPVTKLIETMSAGLGTLYEPKRIRQEAEAKADAERIMAQAAADAAIIKAKGSIEVQMVALRASERIAAWELRRQQNLEAIADLAIHQLPESVNSKKVDRDWIAQFLNYAQDVSNEDMQGIWARLLAGEVTQPGSFSLRTLQLVGLLRPADATLFQKFCGYLWRTEDGLMNFTDGVTDDLLRKQGIGIEGFIHLDSLGLVPRGSIGYAFDAPQAEVKYGGKKYLLKGVQQYRLSVRVLTSVGSELAPLCDTEIDAEYLTHWIEEWKNSKVEVQES